MQFWVPELVFLLFDSPLKKRKKKKKKNLLFTEYSTENSVPDPIYSLCGIPLIYMIDWICFIVIYRFMFASSLYEVLVHSTE